MRPAARQRGRQRERQSGSVSGSVSGSSSSPVGAAFSASFSLCKFTHRQQDAKHVAFAKGEPNRQPGGTRAAAGAGTRCATRCCAQKARLRALRVRLGSAAARVLAHASRICPPETHAASRDASGAFEQCALKRRCWLQMPPPPPPPLLTVLPALLLARRPRSVCLCASLPSQLLDLAGRVIVLQHPHEHK